MKKLIINHTRNYYLYKEYKTYKIFKSNKTGLCCFSDLNNNLLTDFKYNEISTFANGFAKVEINNKYGFVNENFEEICPIKYSHVFHFNNNVAVVYLKGNYGIIDTSGGEIINCKFDNFFYLKNFIIFQDSNNLNYLYNRDQLLYSSNSITDIRTFYNNIINRNLKLNDFL
jgi:hypothetical protein